MRDLRDPREAERLKTVAPEAFHTRRDFLKRTAVTAGLTAGMGLVLDPDTLVAEAARRQRRVRIPSPRNLPIDTFVVLMMENRSFDHYLGWLPGADGRQAGLEFTDPTGHRFGTHRLRTDFQGCAFLDPDHSWKGGRTELDGGRMDGFLKAASDLFSIGYYTQHDLPFTPHVARAFTAFDRFFCSLLSSTYPNREYMHAAQSYGKADNSMPSGNGFPDTTIFAALSKAGVSNHYYYTDIPVSALWGTPGLSRSSQVQNFYEQAAAGTLPALSFVDPSFNGEDQGTSGDEHPHGDVRVGQAFVADIVHAFMESPQYRRGALFIVYDEWGGFFDHVVPPRVPDLRTSRDLNRDFGQMGFRIPAVVVSPYARRGHVDHSTYGFESILKMIRYRYGLPPLTPRDLYTNNIAAAFDYASPHFTPPALPHPAHVISSACSGSLPVGSGGVGIDGGSILGSPLPVPPPPVLNLERRARRRAAKRPKPHDLQNLVTSGYLERLGFEYKPATAATMFRHPSKLGMRP
ncbi:MAG: alkaline phosphatase family protein [Actinomycetota bacterium]|nr:alkaline phosphatase family protein [Actinomycetota bacterium]